MQDSLFSPKGQLLISVYDKDGNLKQEVRTHNIITTQGDQYITDQLSASPVTQKMDGTHTYIVVGTGYTGLNTKTNTWVNTQVGSANIVDATFPKPLTSLGNSTANVLVFQSTFIAGSLNISGINEVVIASGTAAGVGVNCLAYAQITPSVSIASTDTLVINWQVTFLGS